jgi:hypothetical protein
MPELKSNINDKLGVLEGGFNLYKQTLPTTFPYAFMAILCLSLPQIFFEYNIAITSTLSLFIIGVLGFIAFILINALLFRLYCISNHIPSTFFSSLRHVIFKLIPLLMVTILYCLIVISGTLLLIVPGIILAISLMFSFLLTLIDNKNILQTLIKSHQLVWGNWWHSSLIIFFLFLTNIFVSLLVFIVTSMLLIPSNLTLIQIQFFILLINIFIQSFFLPLIFSTSLILLYDLIKRKTLSQSNWFNYF